MDENEVKPQRDRLDETLEDKLRRAEEHEKKATNHAIFQTKKVDELKVKLQAEKDKNRTVEARLKDAEKKNVYLDKAVQNLRSQLIDVEGKPLSQTHNSSRACDREECRGKIQELETQIGVLQQQVGLFKEDFDSERKDREKIHAEYLKLRERIKAEKQTYSSTQRDLYQRDLEVHALKETRDAQETTIRRLQQEVEDLRQRSWSPTGVRDRYNVHLHGNASPVVQEHVAKPRVTQSKYTHGFLTDDQKHQLRKNWASFLKYLRTDQVVIFLFSQSVLTMHQKQEIDGRPTEHEKAEYLMSNILMRATQRDLKAFRQALFDSNQAALADLLPKAHEPGKAPMRVVEEPMELMETGGTPQNWKCGLCTYENYAYRTTCEICGNRPRDYAAGNTTDQQHCLIPRGGVEQCDDFALDLVEG